MKIVSGSPEETRRLAARLAGHLRAGDLIVLSGSLGAGKTAFVQGLASGLGIGGRITSPTFTLCNSYPGAGGLGLHHLDVYRLGSALEALDLDLPDLLEDEAVVAVEWGEQIAECLPPDHLRITLSYGDPLEAGEVREIVLDGRGPEWLARLVDFEGSRPHS